MYRHTQDARTHITVAVNILGSVGVALTLLAAAASLPSFAIAFACLPAAAFLSASVQGVAPTELRRDLAAALNGACLLAASGLAVMCVTGVVHAPWLAAMCCAGAALAAHNVFRLTEPESTSAASMYGMPALAQPRTSMAKARSADAAVSSAPTEALVCA